MKMKHLSAFATLVALSLVAACSSSGAGVVPGPTGIGPNGVAPSLQTLPDAEANAQTSPITLQPASLTFSLSGAMKAKRVVVTETKYDGTFRIESSCRKHVATALKDAKGPHGLLDVTPVSAVDTCTVTVIDAHKNRADVVVSVKTGVVPTPSPSTSPSPSPTGSTTPSPSTSPSTSPSSQPTSSASPTASPSTGPTSTPVTQVIANGNFANGLTGWTPCSYAYTWQGATNASPAPMGSPAATPSPTAAITSGLASLARVTSPPADLNPNTLGSAPGAIGSTVALLGDPGSETPGTAGICQTFTVDSTYKYLSFWVWEGGTEYSDGNATQEADILDSTASTVLAPLFIEDNCFWDPGVVGQTGYYNNGCIPNPSDGGTSAYTDWQGGYWVQRGPYDFSTRVGQTVTLFLGVWDKNLHGTPAAPTTYGNEMFVANVQFSNSNTFPSNYPFARHRVILRRGASTNRTHPPTSI